MQSKIKLTIAILIALVIITSSLFAYEKVKDWKKEQYDLGFGDGQMDGRVEGWNSLLDDVCFDGKVTVGINNETGEIVQYPLNEVCG